MKCVIQLQRLVRISSSLCVPDRLIGTVTSTVTTLTTTGEYLIRYWMCGLRTECTLRYWIYHVKLRSESCLIVTSSAIVATSERERQTLSVYCPCFEISRKLKNYLKPAVFIHQYIVSVDGPAWYYWPWFSLKMKLHKVRYWEPWLTRIQRSLSAESFYRIAIKSPSHRMA